MDIEGKIGIVTGAARGIGRATAIALAQAGAKAVVVADVKQELAEETASLVRDAGAAGAAITADLSRPEAMADLVRETEQRFGGLHMLHNNAAIGEGSHEWPDVPPERVATIVDVNLRAVILGTQAALEPIKQSGGGAIVHTSSGAAFAPLPQQAVYAAAKAGVVHFTRSCAPLFESHGVRVSCVCPGLVSTEMVKETGTDGRPASWLQPIIDGVTMLQPSDIAAAVLGLIRDPQSAGKVESVDNAPAA